MATTEKKQVIECKLVKALDHYGWNVNHYVDGLCVKQYTKLNKINAELIKSHIESGEK